MFLSFFSVLPEKCRDSTSHNPPPLPFKSFQMNNHYHIAFRRCSLASADPLLNPQRSQYTGLSFPFLLLPSSRTMAVGSTQPLTEMSTRNHSEGKWCPERKADNLTAICESII
jgi:hypothetical protein